MSRTPADAGRPGKRRPVLAVVLAAVVLVADQVTKHLAVDHLAGGPIHLVGPLSLQLEYNTGVAFSLGSGSVVPVVLAAVAFVGVLAYFLRGVRSDLVAAALGLVLGGALGNLADRFVSGHGGAVVDFVHLGFWPTFNLADASIVLGCALLLLHQARHRPGATEPPTLDVPGQGGRDGTGEGTPQGAADDAGGHEGAAGGGASREGAGAVRHDEADAGASDLRRDLQRAVPTPGRR